MDEITCFILTLNGKFLMTMNILIMYMVYACNSIFNSDVTTN